MAINQVVNNVYLIPLGMVNVFIIDHNGLTLIDCGIPGSEKQIFDALASIGKKPTDIKNILITHLHYDHIGALKAIKNASGAPVYMHRIEAASVRRGNTNRQFSQAPGVIGILAGLIRRLNDWSKEEPIEVEYDLEDGARLSLIGNLNVIYTPGHTVGHLSYLWPKDGGVLFSGDIFTHFAGIGHPPLYEDKDLAKRSLQKIGGLLFDTLCFSHGKPLQGQASTRIQPKISSMIKQLN
ncbi:MAG: MBL fold metallo-hydrolase [Anaerolineae bacterium]|nr:MBL fold metallo-hydrolase [Anaerolineae bacterium]